MSDPKICGRCYCETDELFDSGCAEKPERLINQPIGQYHCPECGAMVVAGFTHPQVCKLCRDRQHPSFDLPSGTTMYACESIGVSGITNVFVVKEGDIYTARVGIALMGSTNMSSEELAACNYNPFHENFRDNYAKGTGSTEEEAINDLKADLRKLADSLWLI